MISQGKDGVWSVDADETSVQRGEIRKARIARGKPTRQWMEAERQRIIDKDASVQVQQMFASSFYLSDRFLNEFKTFWDLPATWNLKEEELGIPMFGAKHHMDLSELPDVHPVILTEQ